MTAKIFFPHSQVVTERTMTRRWVQKTFKEIWGPSIRETLNWESGFMMRLRAEMMVKHSIEERSRRPFRLTGLV